jgi:hypothetical protein
MRDNFNIVDDMMAVAYLWDTKLREDEARQIGRKGYHKLVQDSIGDSLRYHFQIRIQRLKHQYLSYPKDFDLIKMHRQSNISQTVQ